MACFWETFSCLDKRQGYVISSCISFFLFILIIFYWFSSDNTDNFKRTLKKSSKDLLERFDEKLIKVIPINVVNSLVLIILAKMETNGLIIENGTCKTLLLLSPSLSSSLLLLSLLSASSIYLFACLFVSSSFCYFMINYLMLLLSCPK